MILASIDEFFCRHQDSLYDGTLKWLRMVIDFEGFGVDVTAKGLFARGSASLTNASRMTRFGNLICGTISVSPITHRLVAPFKYTFPGMTNIIVIKNVSKPVNLALSGLKTMLPNSLQIIDISSRPPGALEEWIGAQCYEYLSL